SVIVLSMLVASSGRPLCTSSSACLMAERSSGEVVELTAMAKVGPRRTGAAGAATAEGCSGIVEGVNGGRAARGMSAPARSMTPDGGIDEVAVTGRVGGDGPAGADLDGKDLDGTDLDCKDLDGSDLDGRDLDVCFVVDFSDLPTASAAGA